eukprot:m.1440619 g.1440619  ORF g.1440619 m.1440619 type:complete len:177 (+) comp25094_c0_seq17:197-727(+)
MGIQKKIWNICVHKFCITVSALAIFFSHPDGVDGVLDRAVLERCELKGKHPICDDQLSSFEQVLRQNLPFMPLCEEPPCDPRMIDSAMVAATVMQRLPIHLERAAVMGVTPDIDVFGNYTCPLPPPMTEGPIIVGGIGDSGTRGIMCMFVFVNSAFRRNSVGGNDFSLELNFLRGI